LRRGPTLAAVLTVASPFSCDGGSDVEREIEPAPTEESADVLAALDA